MFFLFIHSREYPVVSQTNSPSVAHAAQAATNRLLIVILTRCLRGSQYFQIKTINFERDGLASASITGVPWHSVPERICKYTMANVSFARWTSFGIASRSIRESASKLFPSWRTNSRRQLRCFIALNMHDLLTLYKYFHTLIIACNQYFDHNIISIVSMANSPFYMRDIS